MAEFEHYTKDPSLPEPPQEPSPSDCCGSGCTPCVFDIYEEELCNWKTQCQKLLDGENNIEDQRDVESAMSMSEYRKFVLQTVTSVTKDTNLYRFGLLKGQRMKLSVGQHIVLRGCVEGKTYHRKYTPVSPSNCSGYFDVLIKLYEEGKMSSFVKTWKVGDQIEWRGPFGNFYYRPNQYRHLAMLAGGTGIAPMVQVIREVVTNDEEDTFVHLIYACSTYIDLLMKSFLDEMKAHWNFDVTYAISKEYLSDKTKVKYGDRVCYGRINKDLILQHLPKPQEGIKILICGTRSFDKDMINHLKNLGYSPDMYYKF